MAGDNEKIGGRRKKSANRTNLDPLKDKGFKKRCKKSKKNFKKSVDRKVSTWYYVQARLRATNLENDTE